MSYGIFNSEPINPAPYWLIPTPCPKPPPQPWRDTKLPFSSLVFSKTIFALGKALPAFVISRRITSSLYTLYVWERVTISISMTLPESPRRKTFISIKSSNLSPLLKAGFTKPVADCATSVDWRVFLSSCAVQSLSHL